VRDNIKHFFNIKWEMPGSEMIKKIISSFSSTEKAIFYILATLFTISALFLLSQTNKNFLISVPAKGGTITEGIVGSPRFINPLLAVYDTDKDLISLIYSGLMKSTSDGDLIPDLAKEYTISADGLEYDFILKDILYFHDGQKLTTDDIEFTVKKSQDPDLKSPKRPSLYEVKMEKISDKEIKFILAKPYAPFLETMTLGILPKHIWNNFTSSQFTMSQYNVEPIGSGPYMVKKMDIVKKNMLITPVYYELAPFNKYALDESLISKIIIKFFSSEKDLVEAFNKGDIESMSGISESNIQKIQTNLFNINTSLLPRVFAVFFNQNQSTVLANKEVRLALDKAINKDNIVKEVLGGYGDTLNGPVPTKLIDMKKESRDAMDEQTRIQEAKDILTKGGWSYNDTGKVWEKIVKKKVTQTLNFSLTTANSEELIKVANIIKQDWEKIGVFVDIKPYDSGDLQQNIIRPRKYDALLFGEVIGRDLDLYAYWHSSQRNDPGYNVSMYTNSKADKLLEDARKVSDPIERNEKYQSFYSEVQKDIPAVFLYSPDFTYITPNKVKGIDTEITTIPAERFLEVNKWYIETNNIWKIFLSNNI
jgi:peptide/nickel transport system substrate-binding protein